MTTTISREQNEKLSLQRLAAQRQLYSDAKQEFGIFLLVAGPVAVLLAVLALAIPETRGYVVAIGIAVTMLDLLWFTPRQKRLRESAAKIQETFDCHVLQLPWSEMKAGGRPDPELVTEQAARYAQHAAAMPPLKDWYAPEVDQLPLYIGRIACQRSNVWWDSRQRRQYARYVLAAGVSVLLVSVALAWFLDLRVKTFVLTLLVPLAPIFVLSIRQHSEHVDAASRLDRLKDHATRLWHEAMEGEEESYLTTKSRSLQDEIFDNRRKSPPVFDFVFKRLRDRYNSNMGAGVRDLVMEAKGKGF